MEVSGIIRPRWTSASLVLVLTSMLAACAQQMHNVDSNYYSIPSGSKLILHQNLNIPAGKAHVNIQGGGSKAGLNNFNVGCEIEVRKLGPSVVTADTFIITRAESSQEWVNRPSTMRFYRTMYLKSDSQPNVMNMVCQYWDYPLHGKEISVAEMREALGSVVSFEFAQ
jgi:hypothetical protein